ncbi:ABC transporter permease [Horticoccus luteus]|uniref:ABC transporter permease n=1 Tax=Horticoccus luteus TaxID=2862869 RepID=A0A8F9TXH0_9BACT|nr:ABC transporter permease [Horticoccus luteus]QYM79548.1 ABC transporter permease [Horticoccus luteus]
MSVTSAASTARASVRPADDGAVVTLGGDWRITQTRPKWAKCAPATETKRVEFQTAELGRWDSSLLVFLLEVKEWCTVAGAYCDLETLPEKLRAALEQIAHSHATSVPFDRSQNFLVTVGLATGQAWKRSRNMSSFIGETAISAVRLVRLPHKFRWGDCVREMQQCGAMALPIVSLISLLVGLIMAYQAAVQLRQFGADIFVADLVGLSVVREMGPMMAAVILAGRTGAAFAATLGNMKAGEEIDALQALGISPVDFLVMPRILALALMMPLLVLYANCLGILGGMVVGAGVLQIPPSAYWIETQSIIDLSDVSSGLIKAVTFGLLIGLSGCFRGLAAERSAAGVGRAATSAVVTSILLIIVADAVFAVIFNILGL